MKKLQMNRLIKFNQNRNRKKSKKMNRLIVPVKQRTKKISQCIPRRKPWMALRR